MRNLRSVIFGLSFLIGGAFLADYFGAELGAQQQTVTEAQSCPLCKSEPWDTVKGP